LKKKVLLLIHEYSNIYKNIIWDLEAYNYEVTPLIYSNKDFKYRSFSHQIKKIFLKTFFLNKTYKHKLFDQYREDDFFDQLKENCDNYFDQSLVIRADLYTNKIIKEVIRTSKYNISFHWDGMDRFPKIQEKILFFDQFYVFEQKDFNKYSSKYPNINLATNFYFEHNQSKNTPNLIDIFYIGSYVENRWNDIYNMYNILNKLDLNIKILICGVKKTTIKKLANNDLIFFSKPISYHKTLEMSKSSKVVLDFTIKGQQGHNGLSLRFFEAMFHKNKIITDNIEVKKFDFYNSKNIFIIGYDNYERLENFIKTPYSQIDNRITKKYSFINWFNSKINNID